MMSEDSRWVRPSNALVEYIRKKFGNNLEAYRANATLVREHANQEAAFGTGGYADRQLSELVQNAADAISAATRKAPGRIEVVLTDSALYCANEGAPWSEAGIEAVTHAYLSNKEGDAVGRFGLGFKSVLRLSTHVQVFSDSISFEFSAERSRAAIAGLSSSHESGAQGRFPILRLPHLLDAAEEVMKDPILNELSSWATTVVKLADLTSMGTINSQMREFRSELLLFSPSVSSLRLRIMTSESQSDEVHECKRVEGNDELELTLPSGEKARWLVISEDHRPSEEAQQEAGRAFARDVIKISYAAPLDKPGKTGEFWAYSPLKDETSAKGIFNAPWSISDDRTTLNDGSSFNREILEAMVRLFVKALPKLRTNEDPARHLDYLPARPDESSGEADSFLRNEIPKAAALESNIPDATGVLRVGADLVPLDPSLMPNPFLNMEKFRLWSNAGNTRDDVPHFSAYAESRKPRLRDLLGFADPRLSRSRRPVASPNPSINLRTWLEEYAETTDPEQITQALRWALEFTQDPALATQARLAKIIPLLGGGRASLLQSREVFIGGETSLSLGFRFIDTALLVDANLESSLRQEGFIDLDPRTELEALLRLTTAESGADLWEHVWRAIDGVPVSAAVDVVTQHVAGGGYFEVLTTSRTWRPASEVLDLDELGGMFPAQVTLDTRAMNRTVAAAAGVVTGVSSDFDITQDAVFPDYLAWAQARFSQFQEGTSTRPAHGIFTNDTAPGPISPLRIFFDGDSEPARLNWTRELLGAEAEPQWTMKSSRPGGIDYRLPAPHIWAVMKWGLIETSLGPRKPMAALHPDLVGYADFLPVAQERIAEKIPLKSSLQDISLPTWEAFLARDVAQRNTAARMGALVELICVALQRFPELEHTTQLPAVVNGAFVSSDVSKVLLCETEDEARFLSESGVPHLLALTAEERDLLISAFKLKPASTEVSFSLVAEGQSEPEALTDVYPALRVLRNPRLADLFVIRCRSLAKRVTTTGGASDDFVDHLIDGRFLFVAETVEDSTLFDCLNDWLQLGLTPDDLRELHRKSHSLEVARLEARCVQAASDAERLEIMVGPRILASHLPQGLLSSLRSLGRPVDDAAIAHLFLSVYGSGAIEQLKEAMFNLGAPDQWAGSRAASTFVERFGFSNSYAGERNPEIERQFTVLGKPGLKPLHPYQLDIMAQIQEVLTAEAGSNAKAMVELPTGSGKTRVAVESTIRLFLEDRLRGPVLWIAQSDELCEQAVQTWSEVWREFADTRSLTIGRLWSNRHVNEPQEDLSVVVATDQKLIASVIGQGEYEWLANASAVIIDEAHVAGDSVMYSRILKWLGVDGRSSDRPLIGLSATPFRGSSQERTERLTARFGRRLINIPSDSPFEFLQNLGVLAEVKRDLLKGSDLELSPDERLEAERFARLSPGYLQRVANDEQRTKRLLDHISRLDPSWPVLVFTASVLSSQVLSALLNAQGIPSASISGDTRKSQRRKIIDEFKQGNIRVLTNCEVLTEGFDAPNIRALYIAKPTLSPNAYMQMAGRGLRGPLNGGSETCLIVDLEDTVPNLGRDLAYRAFREQWGQ
jgi:superfamily II DNA or RNA helicase